MFLSDHFALIAIHSRSASSCVEKNGFCPSWIITHIDRYIHPLWQHLYLSIIALGTGLTIALALGLIAHRQRWLIAPLTGLTGLFYTLPSIAAFFLLQPITGRGNLTAITVLTSYTLLIIFRNVLTGLDAVPVEVVDAGRGIGLSELQLLWKVKFPQAVPEIITGIRIAAATTVGLAALAFFAGAGGLGAIIFADITFKSNVIVAGSLCILLAASFDVTLMMIQHRCLRWQKGSK